MNTTDYHNFTYYKMPIAKRRSLNVGDIYDNTIECKHCGWIIRSRNKHDLVDCNCGSVSVDGGSWYHRVLGNSEDYISHLTYFRYR